jgi:mono/diheme cytochrome c family protein
MLLQQLGFNVLSRGDTVEISALVDVVGRLPVDDWRAGAIWRGAAAHLRNGPRLELEREPTALVRMQHSSDKETRVAALALLAQLSWPGDGREVAAALPALTPSEQGLFDSGQQQYTLICAACHQPNGMGLLGVAPPLVASEWVMSDKRIPIEIIVHGLVGPITVREENWNMVMPGLGAVTGLLDDQKIAGIVTYLRRAWGNQATAITPEEVAQVRSLSASRKQMWTAEELKALPPLQSARTVKNP